MGEGIKIEVGGVVDKLSKEQAIDLLALQIFAKLSKGEANTLLYLESCLVDGRGNLQPIRMNGGDWKIMDEWKAKGLIDFGRRSLKDIKKYPHGAGGPKTHWVKFSDQAWALAHKYRRERAERHVATLEEVK